MLWREEFSIHAAEERYVTRRQFGSQRVTTKVFMMVPEGSESVAVDVVDYMWEKER